MALEGPQPLGKTIPKQRQPGFAELAILLVSYLAPDFEGFSFLKDLQKFPTFTWTLSFNKGSLVMPDKCCCVAIARPLKLTMKAAKWVYRA